MDGGGARSNCCAIGVWAPRVLRALKTEIWYSGTLVPRNGSINASRNGRETLEPVANAFAIGHPLS